MPTSRLIPVINNIYRRTSLVTWEILAITGLSAESPMCDALGREMAAATINVRKTAWPAQAMILLVIWLSCCD